ncbi:MAG: hypothetical protein IJQ57_09045, partial [Synergistaceae bacterium]|nr:hypothetical protein [Synergistaceae bacterium]
INAQYDNNRHDKRGRWFTECVSHNVTISGSSYSFDGLNTSKIKRVKWFVDTATLPSCIDLRYYEEGKVGYKISESSYRNGDNFTFPFFIKKSPLTDLSLYRPTAEVVNGVTLERYFWVRVKIVTDIGYDEKYVPVWLSKGSVGTVGDTTSTNYQLFFYRDSTVAPDISKSYDL